MKSAFVDSLYHRSCVDIPESGKIMVHLYAAISIRLYKKTFNGVNKFHLKGKNIPSEGYKYSLNIPMY